jgi:hypothetical protein
MRQAVEGIDRIDPVVLGGGKGIFPADGTLRRLQLAESEVTSTGAILATYARMDD